MRQFYLLLFLLAGITLGGHAQTQTSTAVTFTPGNLVIYRVGDGAGALTNAATAVFLDEYTPSGTLVQSIPLPTAIAGANKRMVASGTATSEGLLTRSVDKRYLMVTGYDAALGTTAVSGTASATTNRVVGRVDNAGNIDATTGLTDAYSANSFRSAASTNGTDIWISGTGTNPGSRYTTFGATTSTQLSTTVTNLRASNIFNGQLYVSAASGAFRLATVGTGTPTTAGQTITNLPGFPTAGGSPYGFFFADLDAGVPGVDVVYVADDGVGTGFQKYSLVAGSWVANGNIAVTGNGLRGITGVVNGTTVTLYATNGTTGGGAGNNLFSLVDNTGYNATISGTVNTVATAATNMAFRGVALAPCLDPTVNAGGNATTCAGSGYTLSGASSTNGPTVTWTTAGTGSFSPDANTLNATYNPSAADIAAGTVVLTLNGSTPCGAAPSSNMTLTITPAATADAGGNQSICGGNTFTPSGATATNNSGVNWTTSGDGTFANGTTLTPTYTPGIADLILGSVTLTLTATGNSPCANASSNMTLTITTTGVLAGTAGGPQVCQTKTVGIGATYNDGSCNTIATVIPAGASPVSGSITTCVKVESSVPTYNSMYYVARHYDVEPAVAPSTSSASVTLYFSPTEMAAFNANPGALATHYPLPVLPTDNTDSVRIEQYHGTGSDPTNYTGALETWSTANGLTIVFSNGYWAITVPATSFSGFWLTAKLRSPLPIKVAYFRGAKQGSSHVLDWKVEPVNTANGTLTLERSNDGRNFSSVYSITASAVRMQQPFNFTTNDLLKGTNYYRLKMTDDNGVVTYSGIVALLNSSKGFELVNITPNPVTEGRFKLNITAAEQLKMEVVVTDMMGRVVSRQTNNLISGFNAIEVNVNKLNKGVYQVMGIIEGERTKALKFVKQ